MLTLANHTFTSRLLTGTGKFSNATIMKNAVAAAQSNIVTLAMKRVASSWFCRRPGHGDPRRIAPSHGHIHRSGSLRRAGR